MDLPQASGNWRKVSLSLAGGVAILVVIIMTLVLLPIAPLLPTPDRTPADAGDPSKSKPH
jgi:hypothetical protein